MQAIISFLTRFVPRHWLHVISHWSILRIAFLWSGDVFEDPISGNTYRKMLPYGRINSRPNALAPHSLSLERHRILWLFLQRKTDFFTHPLRLLHLAPEYCFLKLFRDLEHIDYITADLNSPWADMHFDVHEIPFENDSFDVVMGNHLMEHVTDDLQVFKEFYRVMKPGGWGVFQVPIDFSNPNTIGDPNVTDPRERERLYWQSDHVRLYGYEGYIKQLEGVGFDVKKVDMQAELGAERTKRYALGGERFVYHVTKPVV